MSSGYLVFHNLRNEAPIVFEVNDGDVLRRDGDVLGRDPDYCQIMIPDGLADPGTLCSVSTYHAQFISLPDKDRLLVVDQATTAGTYVDGERISVRLLHSGCAIAFGTLAGVFYDNREAIPLPTTPPETPPMSHHERVP
jgi:pSer/pThr/pTyr-binding forkhead associated (FHA) protein